MKHLASIIGSIISIFPAVPIGKLQYRTLGREKILPLKNASNFEAIKKRIKLVIGNHPCSISSLNKPEVDFVINTGANESGWRAIIGEKPYWSILVYIR